jgi:hypothetical protein
MGEKKNGRLFVRFVLFVVFLPLFFLTRNSERPIPCPGTPAAAKLP